MIIFRSSAFNNIIPKEEFDKRTKGMHRNTTDSRLTPWEFYIKKSYKLFSFKPVKDWYTLTAISYI